MMRKAIVTGATGFLGACLVRELASRGMEVIAVVRSGNSDTAALKQHGRVRTVVCPLEEMQGLPCLVKDRDVDVFYHLAWAGTSGVERGDVRLQLGNVQAACDAVKAAAEIGCAKFVNAGSIMEYEAIRYIPMDGSAPGLGSIYSTAKQAADFMAKTLAASLSLPYVNAIISNIYGAGEKSERFINTTLGKFLNNERAAFTHGEQLYDFIYISDAARAFYLIGEKGKAYNSYYVGSQAPHPLKEFVIRMRDAVDSKIELNFGEIPFKGALLKYDEFDMSKPSRELGFVPEISFEQGIEKTVEWIKGRRE
jgi:nucleoside-diphosphate-sugar epimerase